MKALRGFAQLLTASLVCVVAACASARHRDPARDVIREIGPPPRTWRAGIAFYLEDGTRVEFHDGIRTRVVTWGDTVPEAIGRSPRYRIHLRDTMTTVLRVRVEYPGAGTTTAAYPLTMERRAFSSVHTNTSANPTRWIIGARDPLAFPIPPAAQQTPADSLWIWWGARGPGCWTCPS